jgi:hypothetical protein
MSGKEPMPLDAGADLARPGLKTQIPIAKEMLVQVFLEGVPRRGQVISWTETPKGLMVRLQIKKRDMRWLNDKKIGEIEIPWSACMPLAVRAEPIDELRNLFPKEQRVYVQECPLSPWRKAVVTSVFVAKDRDEPFVRVQFIEQCTKQTKRHKRQDKVQIDKKEPKKGTGPIAPIKPIYVQTERPLAYDYQKLGLAFGTGREVIEKTHEQLQLEYDPDKNPGNTTDAKKSMFLEIQESYKTLMLFREGDKLYESCLKSASGRWEEFKVIEQTVDGYVLTPIDPDEGEEASRCVTKTEAHSNYLPDDDDSSV